MIFTKDNNNWPNNSWLEEDVATIGTNNDEVRPSNVAGTNDDDIGGLLVISLIPHQPLEGRSHLCTPFKCHVHGLLHSMVAANVEHHTFSNALFQDLDE